MALSIRGLSFSYGAEPLVQNFALEVSPGEPTLLKGDSGSGKTTLLKLCAGLLVPASGEISLAGENLKFDGEGGRKWRREQAVYLDQDNSLVANWSVQENWSLVNADRDAQTAVARKFGLENLADSLVGTLSGGERQRAAIARLLLRPARLALVDEPTSHLDDRHTRAVLNELIRHFQSSVLIVVSHDRRLEEYMARVIPWQRALR